MAMPTHVYRIKNAAGATVKRVGAESYYTAKRLADSWAATLTAQTGAHHKAEKVRNTYGGKKPRTPADRQVRAAVPGQRTRAASPAAAQFAADRKSTRLNSSHHSISYAVFCLK